MGRRARGGRGREEERFFSFSFGAGAGRVEVEATGLRTEEVEKDWRKERGRDSRSSIEGTEREGRREGTEERNER